jgi:hypothetical protein
LAGDFLAGDLTPEEPDPVVRLVVAASAVVLLTPWVFAAAAFAVAFAVVRLASERLAAERLAPGAA